MPFRQPLTLSRVGQDPALNEAITTLLSSGLVVTLTPSASAASVQSESTQAPREPLPLTPVVSSSVAQSHPNERFSSLSTVSGSASAARLARIHRQTGARQTSERAQESEPATEEEEEKKVYISVTFYLWEGRKDIIQLFGKYKPQGGLMN